MKVTMLLAGKNLLTPKEIAFEVGVTVRSVRDFRKEFKLRPVDFIGLQPLFDPEDVRRAKDLRLKKRLRQIGVTLRT